MTLVTCLARLSPAASSASFFLVWLPFRALKEASSSVILTRRLVFSACNPFMPGLSRFGLLLAWSNAMVTSRGPLTATLLRNNHSKRNARRPLPTVTQFIETDAVKHQPLSICCYGCSYPTTRRGFGPRDRKRRTYFTKHANRQLRTRT